MTPDEITALFTRPDGGYLCARWGRPMAPVVFGVDDATLGVVKGAFEAVTKLAGRELADTDPELGANLMVFFFRDWAELLDVPDLDRLIEGLAPLVARLEAEDATQYRVFRFDQAGAIRAVFVFLRMGGALQEMPVETLALGEAVQAMLTWSDTAFADRSPLGVTPQGRVVLRPELGALIRAAYEPTMPVAATDPAHALRLAARLTVRP